MPVFISAQVTTGSVTEDGSGDFHLIEKANGIKYLYASVDRYPNVRTVVNPLVDRINLNCSD